MFVGAGFGLGGNDVIVAKYVVVNGSFQIIETGTRRITSSQLVLTVGANLQAGYYRVYVTYSALGNEHFFNFWGNIQKN